MTINWMDRLSALFHKAMCKEERKQLDQLKAERDDQERRLEEITKATLDGESGWFRELARRDPSCILRVLDSCDKEIK